jgi:hypothetical protein
MDRFPWPGLINFYITKFSGRSYKNERGRFGLGGSDPSGMIFYIPGILPMFLHPDPASNSLHFPAFHVGKYLH